MDYSETVGLLPRRPTAVKARRVTVPAREMHEGLYSVDVALFWECPVCGGPRGNVYPTVSYDGSRRLAVDGWVNPCGHIDFYSDVRKEARENGLNS